MQDRVRMKYLPNARCSRARHVPGVDRILRLGSVSSGRGGVTNTCEGTRRFVVLVTAVRFVDDPKPPERQQGNEEH